MLLEAAASGLPIVTTNVGGSAEIFNDEQADGAKLESLLIDMPTIPTADSTDAADRKNKLNRLLSLAMSQRILELLRTPNELAQFSQQLRLRAINAFSIEGCAFQIASHYKALTATR